jgi:hypothetical protein
MASFKAASLAAVLTLIGAGAARAYSPGDHVEAYSSMTGAWEKATIQRQDGTMGDGQPRWFVHADRPDISNAYFGVPDSQVRPVAQQDGAAPAGPPMGPPPAGAPAPAAGAGDFPPPP